MMVNKHRVLSLVLVVALLLVSTLTLARASFLWDLGFKAGYHEGAEMGYTSGITDGYRIAHHRRALHIQENNPRPEDNQPYMYHREVKVDAEYAARSRLTAPSSSGRRSSD